MYVQSNVGLLCCVGSAPIVTFRPIHTYHAVPMPFPCHTVLLRVCLSHLIYTVRPCLIHTFHAMPLSCFDHAVLLKATAQHVRREMAGALPARVRLLPATTWTSTKVVIRSIPVSDAGGHFEIKQRLSWTRKRVVAAHYKRDELLHCWTSSSDISGYHANFHEGHGTIGAWHGHGMICVTSAASPGRNPNPQYPHATNTV